jgi:hypothetical protein
MGCRRYITIDDNVAIGEYRNLEVIRHKTASAARYQYPEVGDVDIPPTVLWNHEDRKRYFFQFGNEHRHIAPMARLQKLLNDDNLIHGRPFMMLAHGN